MSKDAKLNLISSIIMIALLTLIIGIVKARADESPEAEEVILVANHFAGLAIAGENAVVDLFPVNADVRYEFHWRPLVGSQEFRTYQDVSRSIRIGLMGEAEKRSRENLEKFDETLSNGFVGCWIQDIRDLEPAYWVPKDTPNRAKAILEMKAAMAKWRQVMKFAGREKYPAEM